MHCKAQPVFLRKVLLCEAVAGGLTCGGGNFAEAGTFCEL